MEGRYQLIVATFMLNIQVSMANISPLDNFTHNVVLNEEVDYNLRWKFDRDIMTFEVHCRTKGFVGFGLSPNGNMKGADIIIGGVKDNGETYFEDYHADGNTKPLVDKSQDWTLLEASETSTHTLLKFERQLDTCDVDEDFLITFDTIRVIWACGLSDVISYHGAKNRGTQSVHLMAVQQTFDSMPQDEIEWPFLMDNIHLPDDETTYWCQVMKVPNLDRKHHMIKVEPVIQPDNLGIVHHQLLYTCSRDFTDQEMSATRGPCTEVYKLIGSSCRTGVIAAWAIGGGTAHQPKHVGLPFGDEDSPRFVMLNMHYTNPERRNDITDSSGVRLTLTSTLRDNDSGIMMTGRNTFNVIIIPPGVERFLIRGTCHTDTCWDFPSKGVPELNVFAVLNHAHLLGSDLRFRHIRNGEELPPLMEDRHYDFNFQEYRMLPQERIIKHGDVLLTDCYMDSRGRTNMTYGGESTFDEMCLSFFSYYPKVGNMSHRCRSTYDPVVAFSVFGDDVEWRSPDPIITNPQKYANMHWKEAMEKVNWSIPQNVKRLEEDQLKSFYYACGDTMMPVAVSKPFTPPARQCTASGGDVRYLNTRLVFVIALISLNIKNT